MDACIQQCRYLILLADSLLEGIDDAHVAVEPRPGLKTAGWLVGHLAITADFGRRLCGHREAICPREWRTMFNPGSRPSTDPATYPSIALLREKLRAVYSDLCVAAGDADPSLLAAVNPYEPARNPFYTAGEFVAYMLSGHFAYHVGQLSAWRAAAGIGRAERPDNLAA
jgi:hypothetical protein